MIKNTKAFTLAEVKTSPRPNEGEGKYINPVTVYSRFTTHDSRFH